MLVSLPDFSRLRTRGTEVVGKNLIFQKKILVHPHFYTFSTFSAAVGNSGAGEAILSMREK
jgi:hypothetical protein